MIYPLVLELAADRIPVAVACRVLGFSKQAFYRWRTDPVSQRDWEDAHLTNAAIDAHRDDPTFGYRFKLWLTDITEHSTAERKLYLCAIKDACSRSNVGYSIGDAVLARRRRPANGGASPEPGREVVHSDRGSQFRSKKFVRSLGDASLLGSMGRVGACADNAAMESFFALLQKNVPNRKRWTTREELRLTIITWIEATYHRKRRQRGLGKLTPTEYESIINPQAALAALTN